MSLYHFFEFCFSSNPFLLLHGPVPIVPTVPPPTERFLSPIWPARNTLLSFVWVFPGAVGCWPHLLLPFPLCCFFPLSCVMTKQLLQLGTPNSCPSHIVRASFSYDFSLPVSTLRCPCLPSPFRYFLYRGIPLDLTVPPGTWFLFQNLLVSPL